jgi:hypothetical protein
VFLRTHSRAPLHGAFRQPMPGLAQKDCRNQSRRRDVIIGTSLFNFLSFFFFTTTKPFQLNPLAPFPE